MQLPQFFIVCVSYIVLVLVSIEVGDANELQIPPGINCDEEKYKTYSEDFYMQMGLCHRNITILCMIRPSHPCIAEQSRFKVTALVEGNMGRCLIEGNVTAKRTVRFFVEAKRIKNPNQAGSRSLGGEKERHQRGKCTLKYMCNKKKVRSIAMDCGSVIETNGGKLENFTRKKGSWTAPKNFKDSVVYFASKMLISAEQREIDISTARILTSDEKKGKRIKEAEKDEEEAMGGKKKKKKGNKDEDDEDEDGGGGKGKNKKKKAPPKSDDESEEDEKPKKNKKNNKKKQSKDDDDDDDD